MRRFLGESDIQLQVLAVLWRLEKQMNSLSLDPSTEHADVIKRMLSMGLYRYLNMPIPSCIAEDSAGATMVRRWHGQPIQTNAARSKKVQGSVLC